MKMSTNDKLLTSIHHVETLPVPTLQMKKVRLRKIHTTKKPLHPWQTGSRNCDLYYFVGLTRLKKPLRDQVMGTVLVSAPVGGDYGTSVKVRKEDWAAESKERVKRSPERQ